MVIRILDVVINYLGASVYINQRNDIIFIFTKENQLFEAALAVVFFLENNVHICVETELSLIYCELTMTDWEKFCEN